jgi:hypothetical protein
LQSIDAPDLANGRANAFGLSREMPTFTQSGRSRGYREQLCTASGDRTETQPRREKNAPGQQCFQE